MSGVSFSNLKFGVKAAGVNNHSFSDVAPTCLSPTKNLDKLHPVLKAVSIVCAGGPKP